MACVVQGAHISEWQADLQAMLDGKVNAQLDFTIQEVFGRQAVNIEELRCACALVSYACGGIRQ